MEKIWKEAVMEFRNLSGETKENYEKLSGDHHIPG
jgi:hypothetical protein